MTNDEIPNDEGMINEKSTDASMRHSCSGSIDGCRASAQRGSGGSSEPASGSGGSSRPTVYSTPMSFIR